MSYKLIVSDNAQGVRIYITDIPTYNAAIVSNELTMCGIKHSLRSDEHELVIEGLTDESEATDTSLHEDNAILAGED